MRRAKSARQQVGVSLFPFLAVLICTMGALVVLLVLVVKQAEVQAHEQRSTSADDSAQALRLLNRELEDQEFLRQALETQRPQMTGQLAEQRLRLSHLEDHIRDLSRQAQRLQKQLDDVAQIEQVRQQDRGAMEAALAEVRAEIEAAQAELLEAQERAAKKRRSFAIIPYDGPNGTKRRPIYVECTDQAVTIQPEGVTLLPSDFQAPLIPGNPLDAALLAVREYLSRSGVISPDDEPYPLLIVRPGGATAYSMARSAMKSWDDEFGYELIGAEMELEYPPADAQLERVLRQAIEEARIRQAALAAAQPSRFQGNSRGTGGGRERTVLRASPHGGFSRETVRGDRFGGDQIASAAADQNQRRANEFPNDRNSNDRGSSTDRPSGGPSTAAEPTDAQRSSPFPTQQRRREFESDKERNAIGIADNQGQAGPIGFSGQSGQGQGGAMAQSRGDNWALPSKSSGATAYTRPIRVLCFADRLVIVPSTGSSGPPMVTMMGQSTRESMSDFVASIWQHMETWGIAGRSAYWKPVLHVEVRDGGERRFAEMDALLKRSGLVVQRSSRTP